MTKKMKPCWICRQLGFGETYLGGIQICCRCIDKIQRKRVDVAGKQLAEGLAAMAKDRRSESER
jgi:hypothetical protein